MLARKPFESYDFENDDESIKHYGVIGMKHYVHKFGKWQKQAQYAAGQADPDAEKKKSIVC